MVSVESSSSADDSKSSNSLEAPSRGLFIPPRTEQGIFATLAARQQAENRRRQKTEEDEDDDEDEQDAKKNPLKTASSVTESDLAVGPDPGVSEAHAEHDHVDGSAASTNGIESVHDEVEAISGAQDVVQSVDHQGGFEDSNDRGSADYPLAEFEHEPIFVNAPDSEVIAAAAPPKSTLSAPLGFSRSPVVGSAPDAIASPKGRSASAFPDASPRTTLLNALNALSYDLAPPMHAGSNYNVPAVDYGDTMYNQQPPENIGTQPTRHTVADHEHSHRHRKLETAVVAGLITEHVLGKRADKRLESRIKSHDTAIQHDLATLKADSTELRTESLAQATKIESQLLRPSHHAQAERPVAFERQPVLAPLHKQEFIADHDSQPETQRMTAPQEYLHYGVGFLPQSEVVAPVVERVYERRHEAKDDPRKDSGTVGSDGYQPKTLPSGPGVSSTQNNRQGGVLAYSNVDKNTSLQSPDLPQVKNSQYRVAAISGAAGAAVIIVLAVIAYLIF